jgi:hypothetical protein
MGSKQLLTFVFDSYNPTGSEKIQMANFKVGKRGQQTGNE